MNLIEMRINNNRIMQLTQWQCDNNIRLATYNAGTADIDHEETISPGDMVMMLNWYRYQKDNGNPNLMF